MTNVITKKVGWKDKVIDFIGAFFFPYPGDPPLFVAPLFIVLFIQGMVGLETIVQITLFVPAFAIFIHGMWRWLSD